MHADAADPAVLDEPGGDKPLPADGEQDVDREVLETAAVRLVGQLVGPHADELQVSLAAERLRVHQPRDGIRRLPSIQTDHPRHRQLIEDELDDLQAVSGRTQGVDSVAHRVLSGRRRDASGT